MSNNRRGKASGKYHNQSVIDFYLKDHGFKRKHVPKDGCCLFRAVAEQVYLTQTAHWELRRVCAAYIRRNPSKFKSFLTVSLKDYCWKLANCNLWGGEMELVALSELLKRDIIVYQEQHGRITTKEYNPQRVSERDQILLAFTGNNHYDSVWSIEEEYDTSMCQSIIYELLADKVLKGLINQQDKSKALKLKSVDFYNHSTHQPPIFAQYPQDLLRGLGTFSYFNVPFIVSRREREAHEKADRHLAISMQFTIGDQCQVFYEGANYTGDIVSGLTNSLLEVFIKDLSRRVKVPVGDIMLQHQHQHTSSRGGSNKGNTKGRHQKTGSKSDAGRDGNSRKSYSKSGKTQPKADPQPHPHRPFSDPKDSAPLPSKKDDPAPIPKVVPSDDVSLEKAMQHSSSTVGFSDTTVRMSSLMGRGNPLDFFNQASLASINEAPESEWPILHAGIGFSRGHLGDNSGMNAHRFHLDGPPANPIGMNQVDQHPQLPFAMFPSDPMRLLIQEMNPPIHFLKSGTKEGRQQFMYEFAQNALRFYSKYVSDPEIEDSLNDLFCMEFDEFVSSPAAFAQGDFSVATSVTSRDGSQCDIREPVLSDNSEDVTPRVSEEEERTSSDTHTDSPVEPKVVETKSMTPLREGTPTSPTDYTLEKEEEIIPAEEQESVPNGTDTVADQDMQPDAAVNMAPIHPMMIHPGAHPPYGFPGYPHPMWFPSPMFPWPYYPPMGNPFMMPPQMMGPPIRPPVISSPTNEDNIDKTEEDGDATLKPSSSSSVDDNDQEQVSTTTNSSSSKEEDKQQQRLTDTSSSSSGQKKPHGTGEEPPKSSKTAELAKLKEGDGNEAAGNSSSGQGPPPHTTGERSTPSNSKTKTFHRRGWPQYKRQDQNRYHNQQQTRRYSKRAAGGKNTTAEQQQQHH